MAEIKNISIRSNPLDEIMIDGDENRIIKLDLADIGVFSRFEKAIPEMDKIEQHFRELNEASGDDLKQMQDFAKALTAAEKELSTVIDGIFNSPVCDICANGASLFSLDAGAFLYERIVEAVGSLYGDRLKGQVEERAKRRERLAKHTAKYTK